MALPNTHFHRQIADIFRKVGVSDQHTIISYAIEETPAAYDDGGGDLDALARDIYQTAESNYPKAKTIRIDIHSKDESASEKPVCSFEIDVARKEICLDGTLRRLNNEMVEHRTVVYDHLHKALTSLVRKQEEQISALAKERLTQIDALEELAARANEPEQGVQADNMSLGDAVALLERGALGVLKAMGPVDFAAPMTPERKRMLVHASQALKLAALIKLELQKSDTAEENE